MNEAQKKRSAGYFADISKIVFATAVVGPLLAVSRNEFGVLIVLKAVLGGVVSIIFYWVALLFEKQTETKNG